MLFFKIPLWSRNYNAVNFITIGPANSSTIILLLSLEDLLLASSSFLRFAFALSAVAIRLMPDTNHHQFSTTKLLQVETHPRSYPYNLSSLIEDDLALAHHLTV